jgi:type VI secretion system secreted protein Hcp
MTPRSVAAHALQAVALAALLAAAGPALAADHYYLKLDGFPGESTDRDHRDWSEIDRFDWGVSLSSSVVPGGASGRPVFDDFSWEQAPDRSLPSLFNALARGTHLSEVVMEATTPSATPVTYFQMRLRDGLVSQLHLGGSGGDPALLEAALNYTDVEMTYWLVDAAGHRGASTTARYNLKTQTGSLGALAAVYAMGLGGPVAAVPEPGSLALLLAGLAGIATVARRRTTG